jgi:Glycosyltransferase
MRVLFLHAALQTAAEYNSHKTIAEHVDPQRAEPYFVWQTHTQDPSQNRPAQLKRPEQNLFLDFGRDLSVPASPPRIGRALRIARRLPHALPRLREYIRNVQPDVIYTSQQTFDVYLAKRLTRGVLPHIIHLHYPVGHWLGPGMVGQIRRAARLVAASNFIRNQAIGVGVDPQRIFTQHETVPLERFHPGKKGVNLRAEFGWGEDAQVIISVGRLDPSKGHALLLRAFQKVAREAPRARLLIIGATFTRNAYDQELKSLTETLQIQDRVVFAGGRSDVPALLAESDIFSLPTENDACPLVFQEAMASGLPAVAVISGGVPEMVAHEETGLLSEPGDSDALAENLLRLLRDPDLARHMGEAGWKRVHAEFAPTVAAPKWLGTVETLLSLPGRV